MAQRRTQPRTPFAATRTHLAQAMADIDAILPGSIVIRRTRCGKPRCACKADPPALHGPYAEWTRKIAGKTITRRLTPAELAEYQPLFDNAKKLRALVSELQDLTLEIIEPDGTQEPQDPQPELPAPENVG